MCMQKENAVICPPCGENVALATKRGANKQNLFLPLLPRLTAVLPPQGREITTHGFTLIELLVVVLIIGILAAVALPQYQKAVARSRFAALKPIAKAVKDAQEIYFETTGDYAANTELAQLDISIPEGTDVQLSTTDKHEYVSVGSTQLDNRYRIYFNHSENFAGNVYCEALTTADPLCIAEGGATGGPTQGEYTLYLLSGNSTGVITENSPYVLSTTTTAYEDQYHTTVTTYIYSNGSEVITVRYTSPKWSVNDVSYLPKGLPAGTWGTQRTFEDMCEEYPFIEQCND